MITSYLLLAIPFGHPPTLAKVELSSSSAIGEPHLPEEGDGASTGSRVIKVSQRAVAATILIIISTTSPNYATRVQSIRDTWMKRVVEKPSMDLLFVGDSGSEVSADMVQSGCKVSYYEAACKNGDLVTSAYDYLKQPRGEFIDWVFFADDDVYVFPDNLQRMVMSLGPEAVHSPEVWALPGCAVGFCIGLCGGAGYLTNRETLFKIEEGVDRGRFQSLRDEASSFADECGHFGDLSIAQVFKQGRGLPLTPFPEGAFPYHFEKGDEDLVASLQSCTIRPWVYHYPSHGRMDFIHEKGIEFQTDLPLAEDGSTTSDSILCTTEAAVVHG